MQRFQQQSNYGLSIVVLECCLRNCQGNGIGMQRMNALRKFAYAGREHDGGVLRTQLVRRSNGECVEGIRNRKL